MQPYMRILCIIQKELPLEPMSYLYTCIVNTRANRPLRAELFEEHQLFNEVEMKQRIFLFKHTNTYRLVIFSLVAPPTPLLRVSRINWPVTRSGAVVVDGVRGQKNNGNSMPEDRSADVWRDHCNSSVLYYLHIVSCCYRFQMISSRYYYKNIQKYENINIDIPLAHRHILPKML
ncbi:hypothetical protein QTP88_007254 [Uroleucon formosanum]